MLGLRGEEGLPLLRGTPSRISGLRPFADRRNPQPPLGRTRPRAKLPGHRQYNRTMDMTLTAVYEEVPESDGGGYVAYTEELPGAISEGDTLDEARDNLRDAIELLLEANRELTGKRSPGKRVTREKIKVSVA